MFKATSEYPYTSSSVHFYSFPFTYIFSSVKKNYNVHILQPIVRYACSAFVRFLSNK